MINFIQPYSYDLNIGKAYNEAIKPLSGWICITDHDTLKFEGFADRVKDIVDNAKETQVITCLTNRLRKDNLNVVLELFDEHDINKHNVFYNKTWSTHKNSLEVTKMPIAGVFMLFHKSVWDKVKFRENEISFDSSFTSECLNAGFTTHVAKGLYIFHLYRWGKDIKDISHLRK